MQELRDSFVNYYSDAFRYFDAAMLGNLDGLNCGFLAYLFRHARSRRHPLKHVLLLNFLFERFEDFEVVLGEVEDLLDNDGVPGCEKRIRDHQSILVALVHDGGQSLSQAALVVGTSVTTAARFLDKRGGIKRDRRPHVVGTQKEILLRTLLAQGLSRRELAAGAGIRRGFIKDYLAQRPDLKASWEKAHRSYETERHRLQLLAVLRKYPSLPIKAIRRLPGNGFQWLYNNDRQWLLEVLPAIWKR
jgi:hypothetical protein